MKHTKRMLTVFMLTALLITTLALPASAAGNSWASEFSVFPTQSTSSYSTGYTRAIQAFACVCGSNEPLVLIRTSGGIDGVYGTNTAEAVKFIQNGSTSRPGVCDSATWSIIGSCVKSQGTMTANGHTYTVLVPKVDECPLYRVRTVNSNYEYSVNNVLSSGWSVFRAA